MEHHMAALKRGNEFRLRRARLKREIKAGETKVSHVLNSDIPDWLHSEPVGRLIRMIPRMGPTRMRKFLAELDLRELTRTGSLTRRQRLLLKMELQRRGL